MHLSPDESLHDYLLTGAVGCPDSLAEWYHENTKLVLGAESSALDADKPDLARMALEEEIAAGEEFVVQHPKRYSCTSTMSLPVPADLSGVSLSAAIEARRSALAFDPQTALPLADLSTLLGLSYKPNPNRERLRFKIPSAGGLYPLEVYGLCLNVEGLGSGALCHYQRRCHSLELIGSCEGRATARGILTQSGMADAAVVLFISACLPRVSWKYGERGYRYVLLEAGHLAQNLCLGAAAIGLALCPVAGYYDDRAHDLFWLDGVSEIILYALCVGHGPKTTKPDDSSGAEAPDSSGAPHA